MNSFEIINETNEEIKEIDELKKFMDFALKHENIDKEILNKLKEMLKY